MPHKGFGITIAGRMKHAALWDAANKLGGQAALGRLLGLDAGTIGNWINLKSCPPMTWKKSKRWKKKKFIHVEKTLFELTGQTMQELFPVEIRDNKVFLSTPKTFEHTRYIDKNLLTTVSRQLLLTNTVGIANAAVNNIVDENVVDVQSWEE